MLTGTLPALRIVGVGALTRALAAALPFVDLIGKQACALAVPRAISGKKSAQSEPLLRGTLIAAGARSR
jgi:hypothetical protein